MQLSEVVATHRRVAEAQGRDRKIELIADLLGQASDDELTVLSGLLSGRPRQGRIGVGPALLRSLETTGEREGVRLEIGEVDAALSEIAGISGPGARARKADRLGRLLRRADAEERAYLTSLLRGALRQGAGEGLLVEAVVRASGEAEEVVRRDALRLGSVGAATERHLSSAETSGEATRIVLFRPVAPMLATSVEDAAAAVDAFPEALLEAKADGARVQVHRHAGEVRVYTRRSNDITSAVPELVSAAVDLPGGDLVLDGEALSWGAAGPLPFQATMRRIGARVATRELTDALPLRVYWFDCLFADEELIDRPFHQRREALIGHVPAKYLLPARRIGGVSAASVDSSPAGSADVGAFLDEVRAAGFEGLMVKDLASPYRAGRRGAGWLKLKPVQTLDLVVLAAEWGSGRRRGWLSNLHLGARGREPGRFVMLGKTFKGMTDETLAWQTEALLALETRREGNVVFVTPDKVVEVAFEGVQRSARYPGGVSLRFARLRRYRHDKSADDVDTLATVRALLPPDAAGMSRQRDLFDEVED